MEFLVRHGVACEIVPGITSASGAAAYAGIPLTQRVVVSSLAALEADVARAMLCSPTLLLIGEVVQLRATFESTQPSETAAGAAIALI